VLPAPFLQPFLTSGGLLTNTTTGTNPLTGLPCSGPGALSVSGPGGLPGSRSAPLNGDFLNCQRSRASSGRQVRQMRANGRALLVRVLVVTKKNPKDTDLGSFGVCCVNLGFYDRAARRTVAEQG